MTRQEIQALIDAKIKGQGTAVDAGSVLPAILTGILDLIEQGGGGGTADAVQYIPQELTEPQQMQARKNQGLYYSEETPAGVITWDGDTTGKEVIEGDYTFCKVSTDAPPMESVKTVGNVRRGGEESIHDIEDTTPIDGGYVINNGIIIVITESEATIQGLSLSKGVWFRTEGNRFVSKLTYDAYETIHHIEPKYIKDMYYTEGEDGEKTIDLISAPLPSDWRETLIILEDDTLGYARYSTDIPDIDDWVQIVQSENIIPAERLQFQQSEGYYTIEDLPSLFIIVVQTEGVTIPDVGSPISTGVYVLSRLYGAPPTTIEAMLDSMTYNVKATIHKIPQKYLPDSGSVPQLILIDDGGGSNYEEKYIGSMYKEEMTNQVSTLKLRWTTPPQTTQDDWLDCRLISGTGVASIYPEKQGMTVAIASGNNAGIGIYLLEYVVYHTGEERYEHYSMIMAIKVNEGE